MVKFTKNKIIITVEAVNSPFQDWQEMNRSLSELLLLLTTNKEFPVFDTETFWFVELKQALCELDISHEQTKEIEKILLVA